MLQEQLNEDNAEIKRKAYALYERHNFRDGNDFVNWLETKRQIGRRSRLIRRKQLRQILFPVIGMLSIVVVILLVLLFRNSPKLELSEKSLSDLRVSIFMLDKQANEEMLVFGDTHFDFDQSTLKPDAQAVLKKNIQLLKANPDIKVRMAGYTSSAGSDEINQKLSEKRARTVRNFLIRNGIGPERLTMVGYGRTKPAFYEVSPGDINTREAKANMRVLFEIDIK
jgi:outer membrane protein OmpA-like peptidoglycan-associated protein